MRRWIALCLVLLLLPAGVVSAAEPAKVKMDLPEMYSVEIREDGLVSYEGRRYVLAQGRHERRIPQSEAKALFDAFRASGFATLKDEYPSSVSEGISISLTLTDRGTSKTVIDASGHQAGKPRELVALQDLVRRYAERWVSGDDELINELKREEFDFRSREGADLLARAARLAPESLTLSLIKLGAPIDGTENLRYGERPSAIESAAAKGRRQVVRALIEKGALEQEQPAFDNEGTKQAVLRAAARGGDAVLVAEILSHGAEANRRAPRGGSALQEAVRSGDAETVRVLLRAGADPKSTDWLGDTLLSRASNAETARLLLSAGANPNEGSDGRNALHSVSDVKIARVLIEGGADVNKRDANGATPVLMGRSEELTLALIDAGADLTAEGKHGQTLARIAGMRGWKRVLERLYGSAPGWGKILTNPEWIERPAREDVLRHAPRRAREDRVGGRATISCLVATTGRLDGCSIVSQAPLDHAFGDAALEVAKYYRMATLTKTGISVEGATVRVAIAFPPAN